MRHYLLSTIWIILLTACQNRYSQHYLPDQGELQDKAGVAFFAGDERLDNDVAKVRYLIELKQNEWKNVGQEEIAELAVGLDQSVESCQLLAEYYASIDELGLAQSWSAQAEKLGANSTGFYKTLSEIHSLSGRHDLAIDYINKAILINRNDAEMYEQKGNIYLHYGDTLSGIEYLERAFYLNPNNENLSIDIAGIYIAQGKTAKAEKWLLSLEEVSTARHARLLGQLYLQTGRNAEALVYLNSGFEKGMLIAGEDIIYYYKGMNNVDSTLYQANRVLEIDSTNAVANNAKAYCFDKKGYYNSSIQYYEKVLARDSLNQEAHDGIEKVKGKIAYLRQLKERREAIPVFDLAIPKKKSVISNE